jgi:hypothetical protein
LSYFEVFSPKGEFMYNVEIAHDIQKQLAFKIRNAPHSPRLASGVPAGFDEAEGEAAVRPQMSA